VGNVVADFNGAFWDFDSPQYQATAPNLVETLTAGLRHIV
jgi:hypothetical protein